MNYLQRNKFKYSHSKKALILGGILLGGFLVFSLFDTAIVTTVSPLWRAENSVTRVFKKVFANWHSRQTLIEENTLLKEQVASLELRSRALDLSLERETALLALLGRVVDKEGVTASVLTYPPQSPYDLLVVDAGGRDGLTAGSRVNLPEGPELGVVSDVFPSFSKVKLFSTAGEETNAILERGGIPVVLEGAGGGNFRIRVPREVTVEVGDRILSSSLESRLVAVVGSVKVEPTDSFKEVLAKSPANIFAIRFVSILP